MRLTLLTLAVMPMLLGACKDPPVPESSTSLALDPGPNPGKLDRKLSLLWHHHSTGDDLLKGGLRAAIESNNIAFFEMNYEEGKVDGYVIGDKTDPEDFPTNFNTPKYFDVLRRFKLKDGKQHDILMFKSCFPSANIKSDEQLQKYKSYYLSMLPTFKKHPEILFIAMSSPPLTRRTTNPEAAARARAWSKWIVNEYGKMAPNVKVFDLFGAMAVLEGKELANTLPPQFAKASKDPHPAPPAGAAVARMFIPWFNRIVREAGLDKKS